MLVQCRVLQVSRSGYYKYRMHILSQRKQENLVLMREAQIRHRQSRGLYGSRCLSADLQQAGYRCGRHRTRRVMKDAGLVARRTRRFVRTTVSDHRLASPNLLDRKFGCQKMNQVWTSDITYVATREGWLYVCTVIDLYSRRIIGLSMQDDMSSTLTVDALEQALRFRGDVSGLLFHSDRGVQYTADRFRSVLRRQRIRQSMSRKGNCWDNAPTESFFKTLKTELVTGVYETKEEAMLSIFEYIHVFYNRTRLHSTLNYQSPEAFEQASLALTRRDELTVY